MTTYPMKLTCTKCGAVDEGTLHIEDSKPLTDEQIEQIFKENAGYSGNDFISFARAIEAKLKE